MLPQLLLVFDDEQLLDFIKETLNNNFTLFTAKNEKEAIHLLDSEVIQLVIGDITTPNLNGFKICKIIKSSFAYSYIPVLLITENDSIDLKIKGLQADADAYIENTFSEKYLQAQIISLLNNREKIREFYACSPLVHIKNGVHTKADERFMESLNNTIFENIEDIELDIEKIAKCMNMSRITLYRKIKSISVLTPIEVINITRLKKAAELLSEGDYKIYEISDKVGFSSQSNFARNFLKHFNITPTQYMHSKQLKKKLFNE